MKLLIKDDFFEDPAFLRNYALSIDSYDVDDNFDVYMKGGWRGQRTKPLYYYENSILSKLDERIFNLCYEFYDLKNYCYRYSDDKVENLMITSHFHIIFEKNKKSYHHFGNDKFHVDYDCPVAGVMYLNPNIETQYGTVIVDGDKNQLFDVESKYNRLVAYPGEVLHAPSDVFGKTKSDGRMTYTFFIHDKKHKDTFLTK